MDLYRFFDADGRLLYIGISLSAVQRASSHRGKQEWWSDVARMDVERLGAVSRAEAAEIERQAIRTERPLHNVRGQQRLPRQAVRRKDDPARFVVSPSEAAAMLGVTRQMIYLLIGRGQLRRIHVGRLARIPVADILRLVGEDVEVSA